MMYLSRLKLEPNNALARRDLANAYELHRTLCRVFAADAATTPERFLWRLERDASLQASTVLIQASTPGDWSAVEQLPGYLAGLEADKQVALDKLLQAGQHYRFRLRANPTVTREGKRYGLVKEEEQYAWLARQAERGGFALREAVRGSSERVVLAKSGKKPITLHAAQFDGVLLVQDVEAMQKMLLGGIGHAKSLGMGLLSLARI